MFIGFFIGIAPIIIAVVSTAVSIGANALIGALTRPKQDEPKGRVPGTSIGRAIPQVFNTYPINEARWIEPLSENRMFVARGGRNDRELFLTIIGALASSKGGLELLQLKLWGETLYEKGGGASFFNREVDYNPGTKNQVPFPKWIEYEGLNNLNAYRNITTIGFWSLDLKERGNSIPSLKALLKSYLTYTVGRLVKAKCRDAEISLDVVDTAEIDDMSLTGFLCDRNGNSYYAQLEPLLVNHFIAPVELSTGVISFRTLERPQITLDIPIEHLGIRSEGKEITNYIHREFKDVTELPRFLIFSFIDPNRDWENNTVYTNPHPQAISTHSEHITTSEVLNDGEAQAIATKLLYQMYERLVIFSISTLIGYRQKLEALDVITLDNGKYSLQITEMIDKADYTLEIKGFQYISGSIAYAPSKVSTNSDPVIFNNRLTNQEIIDASQIYLLDVPLAFDHDTDISAYVFNNYPGILYMGRENRDLKGFKELTTTESYGTCSNILGFETKDINGTTYPVNINIDGSEITDETSTLIVESIIGDPTSLDEYGFLTNQVMIFVGKEVNPDEWEGEYIVAAIAANLGDGEYVFSDLKRGLAGTEYYIDKHVAGEMYFIVDRNTPRLELRDTDINRNLEYAIKNFDTQATESLTTKNLYFFDKSLYGYPPINFSVTTELNGDLTFSYELRRRFGKQQQYEQTVIHLRLLDNNLNFVREIIGDSTVTYTQADRVADGLSEPYNLNAFKLSAINGLGYPSYVRDLFLS